MDNNTKALKSGFWYILSNLVVRGITLITTPIFARLLTQEQYGNYSNFLSWTNIAVIIITMRMESSLISAKYDYKDNLETYNLSLVSLTAVLTAVWAFVINLFSGIFTELMGIGKMYINLMLIYCFFYAIINLFQMNERFAYRYKRSVAVAVLVALSTMIASIILVICMNDRLTGRVLGGILPVVVIGFALLLYFVKQGKKLIFTTWSYVLKICIPYIPHLLSLQVLNSIDRIMITKICGATDTALYTIAYTCGHMVTLLMTSMNSAFAPWLGDKLKEDEEEEIKRVSKYYIILFSVMAVGMMLLAPEILLFMGGKSYLEAKYVMTPVAMGCVCQFLYTLYVNVEQFEKETLGMAIASIAAAFLNYGLNALLIPKYGYIAAAYTTLMGYIFLLIIHMILVGKLGYGNVYNNKFIVFLVGVMSVITLGVNYLYGHSMFRYIVIAMSVMVIATIVYVKREIIKQFVRRLFK